MSPSEVLEGFLWGQPHRSLRQLAHRARTYVSPKFMEVRVCVCVSLAVHLPTYLPACLSLSVRACSQFDQDSSQHMRKRLSAKTPQVSVVPSADSGSSFQYVVSSC